MGNHIHKRTMPTEELVGFGFPSHIVSVLEERGIKELNPIQVAALDAGLLSGTNLVVVAPTSSGKTLVAELAAVHHGINAKGTFYLVSLKALAEEKYALFKRFWTVGDEPILRTAITTGDREFEDENLSQCKVTFATYEKLYSLVRDNPSLLDHVSLIVVDEMQTLGDRTRGLVLETLLTIIRQRKPNIQIIGLSATMPNPEEVASWLGAAVCKTSMRDIPLLEEVWSKTKIHSKVFGTGIDSLQERTNLTDCVDTLSIVQHQIAAKKTPIVVFCMTKPRAEDLAREHFALVRRDRFSSRVTQALHDLKKLLLFSSEGGPTGKSLMDVIEAGIAFHHADLSQDERRIIEEKIRDGTIEVVYATTTLGQGVNLPIAVVIFDDLYRGWIDAYIDKREYLNMAGRAGRRGLRDEGGTAILVSRSARDRQAINEYLSEESESVESTLESASLDAVVLSLIASDNASSVPEIRGFLENSLSGTRNRANNPKLLDEHLSQVPEIVRSLKEDGFIFAIEKHKFRATEFGRVASQKGVTPTIAKELRDCLTTLREKVKSLDAQSGSSLETLAPAIFHLFLECGEGMCWLYFDRNASTFLEKHRGDICRLRRFEDSSDPYRNVQTVWVLAEWARGTGYTQLCAPFRNVREGYIRASSDCAFWLLDAVAAMSRLPGFKVDPMLSHFLHLLCKRVLFGVSEAGVALMEVVRNRTALSVALSGVGRSKVQELVAGGFDDLNKVVEANDSDLLKIIRSPEQVTYLKEAVVKYLERASGSLLFAHTQRSKRFSQEALIKRVYESLGTDFEVAVHDLLRATSVELRLLDEKKVPGCADLLIATSKGNIQIECKTKKVGRGQVTNTEAFEVMGKTHVGGHPIAYATIGKPGFVEPAIKNSFTKSVALVTHQTVCEVAIQVMEGKRAKEDIEKLFLSGRYVETIEVR